MLHRTNEFLGQMAVGYQNKANHAQFSNIIRGNLTVKAQGMWGARPFAGKQALGFIAPLLLQPGRPRVNPDYGESLWAKIPMRARLRRFVRP
jgi:hypothetical protein